MSYKQQRSPVLSRDETTLLVGRAQRGDAKAFASLVRGYLRAAYAVALAIVGRPADAEDIAQEVFIKALENLHACRQPECFAGWLLQITRHRARNLLDRRRLRDVPVSGENVIELMSAPPEAAGMRAALLDGLSALDQRQREVVLLHDLEGWTHHEIATALGISEVLSRQILWQARQVLRRKLGDTSPLEENHGG